MNKCPEFESEPISMSHLFTSVVFKQRQISVGIGLEAIRGVAHMISEGVSIEVDPDGYDECDICRKEFGVEDELPRAVGLCLKCILTAFRMLFNHVSEFSEEAECVDFTTYEATVTAPDVAANN